MKKFAKSLYGFLDNYSIFVLLFLFFAFFTGRSLLTHYSFNSHSWDLGIYAQQTWLYSQFAGAYNTVRGTNLLSDHFGVILYLFAPIYRLFPRAETILIIQALLVSVSGYPLYLIGKKFFKSGLIACVAVFAYLSSSGIRQAIDFDFHLATVAVFFYAFFIYFWLNKKYIWSIVFALLAILCKEDIPLYIAFAAIGFLARDIKNKQGFANSLWLLLGSLASFFAIFKIMLLIPATTANANYFSFSNLGSNYSDVIKNFVLHPILTFKKIFTEFVHNETKVATFKTYFFGYWYLPILSIDIMVLSIPFLLTKFVSDRPAQWGVNGQYAVIGMFILALATIYSVHRISRRLKNYKNIFLIMWSITFVIFTLNYNFKLVGRGFWDVFNRSKWQNTQQFSTLNDIISQIPSNASLGAQETVVSHVTSRKNIFILRCKWCILPDENNLDYILIDSRFGLGFDAPSQEEFDKFLKKYAKEMGGEGFTILNQDVSADHSTYLLKNINLK